MSELNEIIQELRDIVCQEEESAPGNIAEAGGNSSKLKKQLNGVSKTIRGLHKFHTHLADALGIGDDAIGYAPPFQITTTSIAFNKVFIMSGRSAGHNLSRFDLIKKLKDMGFKVFAQKSQIDGDYFRLEWKFK